MEDPRNLGGEKTVVEDELREEKEEMGEEEEEEEMEPRLLGVQRGLD